MATTSFITARHRLMDKLDAGQFPIRGTATGGSTTTVVDSGASLSGATADSFDHYWIKISTTTDGLAPQGEIRQVSEGGYSAGTFTVPTAFTAAVGAGDTYEVHRGFHPSEMDNALNMMSRNLWVAAQFPLTAHILTNDDNDMENSATSAYTEVGGGALAKSTTVVSHGARGLEFTPSAITDYVHPSTTLDVQSPLTYVTAASILMSDGTANLSLQDTDNSAIFETSGEAVRYDWQQIFIQWTPPSGCYAVQPRFIATTNNIFYLDDYHSWVVGEYNYATPSWIAMKPQIIDIVGYPLGESIANDVYVLRQDHSIALPWRFQQEEYGGTNEVRLWVNVPSNIRPYIVARRPIDAVSFDYGTAGTGTTANTIPLTSPQTDVLVEGAYAELCRRMASRVEEADRAYYTREANRAEGRYRAGIHQMGLGEPIFRHSTHRVAARIA